MLIQVLATPGMIAKSCHRKRTRHGLVSLARSKALQQTWIPQVTEAQKQDAATSILLGANSPLVTPVRINFPMSVLSPLRYGMNDGKILLKLEQEAKHLGSLSRASDIN